MTGLDLLSKLGVPATEESALVVLAYEKEQQIDVLERMMLDLGQKRLAYFGQDKANSESYKELTVCYRYIELCLAQTIEMKP